MLYTNKTLPQPGRWLVILIEDGIMLHLITIY